MSKLSNSFMIVAVGVTLFASTASLCAHSHSPPGVRHDTVPMVQLATLDNEGAQSRPSEVYGEYAGDSNSTTGNISRSPKRSWLVVPLWFYVLPLAILAVILTFKHLRFRLVHKTLRAMIEKGTPITPELIATLKPPTDPRSQRMCYLLPGLICSAVGIGLMVNAGRSGLIPLLVGVAFLIAWQVEKRSTRANQPPRQ